MKLYHYTDANALLSIFEKKELWLTDLLYMNDSMELKNGINQFLNHNSANSKGDNSFDEASFMTEIVAAAAPELNDFNFEYEYIKEPEEDRKKFSIFSISFCQQNNLLSQWRGYTNQTIGYAIEFDYDGLQEVLKQRAEKPNGIYTCVYQQDEQAKLVEDIRNSLKVNEVCNFYDKVFFPLSSLKHVDFEEENEVRLLIADHENIEFRVKKGVICPFIKLDISDLNIIKSVTIGPHHHSDLAKAALTGLLKKYFVDDQPEIIVSDTPFRQI